MSQLEGLNLPPMFAKAELALPLLRPASPEPIPTLADRINSAKAGEDATTLEQFAVPSAWRKARPPLRSAELACSGTRRRFAASGSLAALAVEMAVEKEML